MATAKLGLSVFLVVLALVLAALAFATDHWQVVIVDRDSLRSEAAQTPDGDDAKNLQTEPEYFTRYSGLLRTCYPGNETTKMLKTRDVVDENCIYVDYQMNEAAQYLSKKSDGFWLAMHIRRLIFGLTISGMFMLLLSLVSGTYGCWTVKSSGPTMTAIFLFLALLVLGGAIGTVFGLNYIENHQVPEYTVSVLLAKHSHWMLSWSFYILCCSAGLCLLAFVIVTLVAYSLHREKTLAQRAAEKMRKYYDDLQKKNGDVTFQYENKQPSPLQKAVTEQNGDKMADKMVPILMFDNAGYEHDKGILY